MMTVPSLVAAAASDEATTITITWPRLPQRPIWQSISANDAKDASHARPSLPVRHSTERAGCTPQRRDDAPASQPGGWEYLDHTADIQLHAWGVDTRAAHAAAAVSLHAYMADDAECVGHTLSVDVHASAHDEHSLLYAVLDEFLFLFHTESFLATRVSVLRLDAVGDDRRAHLRAWGGIFDPSVHKQGTEVKAITYSNMQVVHSKDDNNVHIYVIVDI